ncbi:MAG: choice-of-anchor A family protein [Ignavibacteriaceae bacterium]|nr:choice-of-anchor A family protein [Ignavibacteriaceae bacterium]
MKAKYYSFLVALIIIGVSTLVNAKIKSISQVTGQNIGVGIFLPWPVNDTYFTGTYSATVDGVNTSLYCIDLYHHMAYNSDYQDVESTNDTLSYILNNYYPYKTSYSSMLSDVHREAASVQLAIWHLTDALDISTLKGQNNSDISDIKARVAEILSDALTNAHGYSLNTFVINIPVQSFTIGTPVTFTVQAYNDQGLAMPNVKITLSATQGALSATTITTDSTGVTPVITLTPVSGQTTATITASGVVGIPSGTKYYNVADPNGKQKLILAKPTTASRTITKIINWSGSYNLVVNKTADKTSVVNGEEVNYTITVKNTGSGDAQNVKVSDQLSTLLDFVSASPSGVYNVSTGIWSAGTIAAGDSSTLTIKAKADFNNSSTLTYDLGAAKEFNLFVLDTLIQPSADTEGKVAVGGYADLRNYSVGDKLASHSGNVLVVGNHLTFISGSVNSGKAVYQNFITTTTGFTTEDGIVKDSVIDFEQARVLLQNLSNQLSAVVSTDTVKDAYNHVELVGRKTDVNIFNVDGSLVSSANNFTINVPSGSTAIVNISGNVVSMSGGFSVAGTTKDKVLLNFYEADTLKLSYVNITAAILAPYAVLNFPSGVVTGQVIVRCFFGAGQMNLNLFTGTVNSNVNIVNFASLVSACQASMQGIVSNVPYSKAMVANSNSGTTTGVVRESSTPKEFALSQNYPNPFNPSTVIKYQIPKDGFVIVKVYDLIGREVATLVNGYKSAGNYSVNFNASKLASGMYIYQLRSNSMVSTKKMLLIK